MQMEVGTIARCVFDALEIGVSARHIMAHLLESDVIL